ncbi:MAG TPA: exodeoxyribonuclease IX [Deltaproteobacteria bacterium]|nr:exodeoxyribonuclease IX [Deltaproteobacteria bacterium]
MAASSGPESADSSDVGGPLVHLFDGHVYIFRAYHSLPPMTSDDGLPCNAAYGFANTLIRYAAEEDPSHAGVCFDAAMTSFRNEIEPGYKAQRGETPDDLEPQFELCREISVALGFATYEVENYEADDLLGTISETVVRRKARARVLTTDKDLCQLVREDDRVVVHDLAREKTWDADGVRHRFGVSPSQIPDYLGLVGDTVDNLPGVPGVGPKSAAAVLQVFPSIEEIPDDLEKWSDVRVRGGRRLAERIAEHRERALKTKRLATVLRDVPGIAPGLRDLRYHGADRERTEELFERLGWNRIRDRIPKWQR